MINEVTLVGRVGLVPEIKDIPSGNVTNISVATNRTWRDKNKEWHKETEWHNVVLFGKIGEHAIEKVHVGSLVYVKGRIKTTKRIDNQGIEHRYIDIIAEDFKVLDNKKTNDFAQNANVADSLPSYKSTHTVYHNEYDDDDIPF